MLFKDLSKEFYIAVADKLGDITDFLVCVCDKATALLDSFFLQIVVERHPDIVFETLAYIWQTELKLYTQFCKSDWPHIILIDIIRNIFTIIIINDARVFLADPSHGLNDDFDKIGSHQFQIAGIFRTVFVLKLFNQGQYGFILIGIDDVCRAFFQGLITEPYEVVIDQIAETEAAVKRFVDKFRLEQYIDDHELLVIKRIVFVRCSIIDDKVIALLDKGFFFIQCVNSAAVCHIHHFKEVMAVHFCILMLTYHQAYFFVLGKPFHEINNTP